MKLLIAIPGLYLAIGWAVGMVALVRSRTNPFRLLDSLGPIKSAVAATGLWPLVLLDERDFQRTCRRLRDGPVRTDWVMTEIQVPTEWIKRKVADSPSEFDWQQTGYNRADNPGLKELLDRMIPGDELWEFSSSDDSWRNLTGRAGYVLLRNREQVGHLTTIMN